MDSEHVFVRDEVLPSWWGNAVGYFLSVGAFNFLLSKTNNTHLAVPASAGPGAANIAVQGPWRFVEATVSRAHPGGAAGTYDVYVTAKANDIQSSPAPYTDDTDYSFALWIGAAGSTPPIVPGTVDLVRKVGSCQWDGTKITRVDQSVPVTALHSITHHTGGTDALAPADIGAATSTALSAETTRAEDAEGSLSDEITAETGRAEAAESLLAPKASPALTGNPTAPTQPAGNNTTRLATTAFAAAAVGVETTRAVAAEAAETARAEGVEGSNADAITAETARAEAAEALLAPKASPALTGNPTAPTQAAGNVSTRLATTAFTDAAVTAEETRAEAAEALLAPKASPALSGNPTAPTQPAGTDNTRLATTAYVDTAVAVETFRAGSAEAALMPLIVPATTTGANPTVQPFQMLTCQTPGATPNLPAAPDPGTVCGVRAGTGIDGSNPLVVQGSSILRPGATAGVGSFKIGTPGHTVLLIWSAVNNAWICLSPGEDTGWAALTLAANVTDGGAATYEPAARLTGDRIWLQGTLEAVSGKAAGSTLATLPAGLRPPGTVYIIAKQTNSGAADISITASGVLSSSATMNIGDEIRLNGASFSAV